MKILNRILNTLLFLCFLWVSGNIYSQNNANSIQNDTIAKRAHTYLTKLTLLNQFNGVVLLKKGDDVILHKAFNMSSDSDSSLFVSKNSQFDLRSIAKLFAKASVLDLEKSGKLNQNENIAKYIPEFPKSHNITLRHLLNHSSGLPREFSITNKNLLELTSKDIIEYASKEQLEFDPGTKYQYSNVGFQLVYYILEKLSGKTFAQLMRDSYFTPLQMTNSGSNFNDTQSNKNNYAFGHYKKDDDSIACVCKTPNDDMQMGNLYSTAKDLTYFLNSLSNEKYTDLLQKGSISHAGGTKGKRAYIEHNFLNNYQIIFLTNYDVIPFQKLLTDLQQIMLGIEVELPKSVNRKVIKIDPSILKEYVGTYDIIDAGHIKLTIKLIDNQLYLFQKGKNNGILYAESETVFFGDSTSEDSIEFKKDTKGTWFVLVDFQGLQWKGVKIE